MKILVLMPLNESHSFVAHAIYKALPHEVKEKSFIMPAYIDYLLEAKVVENSIYAISNALLAAQILYKQSVDQGDNLIIFGNIDKSFKFDAIFNCQDAAEDLPYEDARAVKMMKLVKGSNIEYIAHELYTNEDSQMALHNPIAIADFLTAYLETDPHLDKLTEEYNEKIKALGEVTDNGDNKA